MSLARQPNNVEEQLPVTHGERALARLQRRDAPKFFIVNPNRGVEFCSPNLVDTELLEASRKLLADISLKIPLSEPVYEELGADSMLRVVPLAGELKGYLAAFIEDARGRNSLAIASERHKLTKREREVLGYILKGFNTPRIAGSMFISEGTVADHVKSILRKTGASSRSELVIRILDHDRAAGKGRTD